MPKSEGRFVVRPTPGLLLRRYFRSSDGKTVILGVLIVVAGLTGETYRRMGMLAAIAVALVLLVLILAVVSRIRMEVRPGELIVANLFRTYRMQLPEIAQVVVQNVTYEGPGLSQTTFRLLVVLNEKDKKDQWVTRPAFATERKERRQVEGMLQEVVTTLQAAGAPSTGLPPTSPA